jgi:DNA polymerase-3 subunit delta'
VTNTFIPWQTQQWQIVWRSHQQQRLSHALLLTGVSGNNKKIFAEAWANTLLCQQPDLQGKACGACKTCRLFQAGSHPDLLRVQPEQEGQMIKIDSIREVVHFVNETAQLGGAKVVILQPANALNMYAANALLKTLEEPAPNAFFMLLSDQSLRLPATITSRCQKIIFPKNEDPVFDEATLVLQKELYQALFDLSQQRADPLQMAAQWHEQDLRVLLYLMLLWLRDLLAFQLSQGRAEMLCRDQHAIFGTLAIKISGKKLLTYIEHVQKFYSYLLNALNLNRQLLLEQLFIRWATDVFS